MSFESTKADTVFLYRTLSARLAQLLPKLGSQELAAATARVASNLAALLRDDTGGWLAPEEDLPRLVPAVTDGDLITLLLSQAGNRSSLASAPIIRMLLANGSAVVRESTLDMMVDRFAAGLPIRERLSASLRNAMHGGERDPGGAPAWDAAESDEAALLEAAAEGDRRLAIAILAAASGLPEPTVRRAADLRSPKELVSLAWRSGFTMRAAVAVQSVIGQLAPSQMLHPGPGGRYPLTRDEMEWHLELLAGRRAA